MAREVVVEERDQFLVGRRDTVGDERGRHDLPPRLVRHAEHRRGADAVARFQHALDFGGIHVLAAADDQVGTARAHVQATVRVEHADVTGVEPRVGGEWSAPR